MRREENAIFLVVDVKEGSWNNSWQVMIDDSYFNCSAILRIPCIISYIKIQSARKSLSMGKFLTSVTL
jgi:hypothetical protein